MAHCGHPIDLCLFYRHPLRQWGSQVGLALGHRLSLRASRELVDPFAEETELSMLDLAMANRDPTTGVTDVILAHCSGCPVPQGKRQSERRRLGPMTCASMIDIVPQGILLWDRVDRRSAASRGGSESGVS